MASISVVDDDLASTLLVEHLEYDGHRVVRYKSADDALEGIEEICASDLLILDLIMEPPSTEKGYSVSGASNAGMSVFSEVRSRSESLPILVYTANNNQDIAELIRRKPRTEYLPKWSAPTLSDFVGKVREMLGVETPQVHQKAFIVHGRDDKTKLEVKNYVQNTLGIYETVILHEQSSRGRTIIEKFESLASQTDLVFVVLTPDDPIPASTDNNGDKRRARQNVIFELGYFLGYLGRSSGRLILLYKGGLELPTDISGIAYIDISNGVEAAGESIRREVRHVLG